MLAEDERYSINHSSALEFLLNYRAEGYAKVDHIYIDPPYLTDRIFYTANSESVAYDDRFSDTDYSMMMNDVLVAAKDILAEGGNIIVQCDWHSDYILKTLGNIIFGKKNNVANIIWHYSSGGASKRTLARKHDTLLVWSNGPATTFNLQREPYATPDVDDRPGFHPEGRIMHDVWNDIGFLGTARSAERTDWPTQKPERLLDRVIELYSNPNDVWLDFFAGSGTAGASALRLGRKAILVDVSEDAVNIMRERLTSAQQCAILDA